MATLRAWLLATQPLSLLAGRFFEGSRRQPAGGSHGHFLHLAQIDIQARSVVTKGMSHDNFSPVLGEFGDLLQILGSQLP